MAVFTAAVSFGPASAQSLDTWDEDGNAQINATEFRSGLNALGLFDEWDANRDGAISAVELETGLYDAWDLDDDGALGVAEWDTAVDAWFGENDANLSEAAWDSDGDGTISRIEFVDALRETGFYSRFGVQPAEDFALDQNAFAEGLFETADLDGDALIGGEEDGLLLEFGEFLLVGEDEEPALEPALGAAGDEGGAMLDEPPLIERGEAFSQLPIPCGDGNERSARRGGEGASGDGSQRSLCEPMAARFCEALGYGPPIDFVAARTAARHPLQR